MSPEIATQEIAATPEFAIPEIATQEIAATPETTTQIATQALTEGFPSAP
jgi:hypothetical protein